MASAAAVLIFLAVSVSAGAQSSPKLYTSITLSEAYRILNSMGHNVDLMEEREVVAWIFEIDQVCLITTDQPHSLNFYTYEEGSVSLQQANEWNKNYTHSKIYLDEDKDIALELDLDMTGGVTEARIRDFFKTCAQSHKEFINLVR